MQPMTCFARHAKYSRKVCKPKGMYRELQANSCCSTAAAGHAKPPAAVQEAGSTAVKGVAGAVHLLEQGEALPEAVHLLAWHLQVEAVQAGAAQQLVQHPEGQGKHQQR